MRLSFTTVSSIDETQPLSPLSALSVRSLSRRPLSAQSPQMIKAKDPKAGKPSLIQKGAPKGAKINFQIDSDDDSELDDYMNVEEGDGGDSDTNVVTVRVKDLYRNDAKEERHKPKHKHGHDQRHEHGHHDHGVWIPDHNLKPRKKSEPSCCYKDNSCAKGIGCTRPSSPKGCGRGCQPGMSWKSCSQGSAGSPCGPRPSSPCQAVQQQHVVVRQPAPAVAHSHNVSPCQLKLLEQTLAEVEAERAGEVEGIARHIIQIQQQLGDQPDLSKRIPTLPKIDFSNIEKALTELDHSSRERVNNKTDMMALMQVLDQQDNDNLQKIRELESMELRFDGSSIGHQVDLMTNSEHDIKSEITNINIHLGDLDGIERRITSNSRGIRDYNLVMSRHLEEQERFRLEVIRSTDHVSKQIARGKEDNERLAAEMDKLEEAMTKLDKDYHQGVKRLGNVNDTYSANMGKVNLMLEKFQIRMGALEHGTNVAKKDNAKLADTLKDIKRNIVTAEDELRKFGPVPDPRRRQPRHREASPPAPRLTPPKNKPATRPPVWPADRPIGPSTAPPPSHNELNPEPVLLEAISLPDLLANVATVVGKLQHHHAGNEALRLPIPRIEITSPSTSSASSDSSECTTFYDIADIPATAEDVVRSYEEHRDQIQGSTLYKLDVLDEVDEEMERTNSSIMSSSSSSISSLSSIHSEAAGKPIPGVRDTISPGELDNLMGELSRSQHNLDEIVM